MRWIEVAWELSRVPRARSKAARFAELYSGGTRVIESAADLTMREAIELKRRFEEDGRLPLETIEEITGRWSIAEPVSQRLPS